MRTPKEFKEWLIDTGEYKIGMDVFDFAQAYSDYVQEQTPTVPELRQVIKTIGLLSSMVTGGEEHSNRSRTEKDIAIETILRITYPEEQRKVDEDYCNCNSVETTDLISEKNGQYIHVQCKKFINLQPKKGEQK